MDNLESTNNLSYNLSDNLANDLVNNSDNSTIPGSSSSSELVTVITLPEIRTTIEQILPTIKAACERACSLECTEDSRKEIKAVRAELNKANSSLTSQFKAAIAAVKAPITAVEQQYKECTDVFKAADRDLAAKINGVENELKRQKTDKLKDYFNECVQGAGIDFLKLEDVGLNVTLSASEKSLKSKIFDFVYSVCDDLNMISTLEYKDEILVEYKKSLDAAQAVRIVNERHQHIEAEKKRREAEAEEKRRRQEAERAALAAAEEIAKKRQVPEQTTQTTASKPDVYETAPVVTAKPASPAKVYTLKFSVSGTIEQLKAFKHQLIELIERNGLNYE